MDRIDMFENKKLLKKGELEVNRDSLILINNSNIHYKVSDSIVKVWNICDGTRDVNELIKILLPNNKNTENNGKIIELLTFLVNADLLIIK
jgi:hypothetical protein